MTTKRVPVEPTMGQWDDFCKVHPIGFDEFILAYKAMLAAAPADPSAGAKLVRVELLNAMAMSFESYADCGMKNKFDNGALTPNAVNCKNYAKRLNDIIAAPTAQAAMPERPIKPNTGANKSIFTIVKEMDDYYADLACYADNLRAHCLALKGS